jgi:16S rRNA (adenine1518-N6/adenine1519-N6)-dimethyltransferase
MSMERLTDPRTVRALLAAQRVHPRKQYGQNFLVDDHVVAMIRERILAKAPETLVEIGPGLGTLTQAVLSVPERLLGVEIDPRLAEGLAARLDAYPQVQIRLGDVLALDLSKEFDGQKIVVLGSLPYRITSPILKHLVTHRRVISEACLITQWEVAAKVASSPSKHGSSLGVLVRAYADVSTPVKIPRRSFWPAPEVDSGYWEMTVLSSPRFSSEEVAFFRVVRTLYRNRRKMIRRALQDEVPAGEVADVLHRAGLDGTLRGETLSFEQLDRLSRACAQRFNPQDADDSGPAR